MRVARDFSFSESEVRSWCEQAGENNPLYIDAQAAQSHPLFEERVVPGMMLLDRVSGVITQWSETRDGLPVLSQMANVDFKEPVPFDHEVEISVEEEKCDREKCLLYFEVSDSDEVFAHGLVTVYTL